MPSSKPSTGFANPSVSCADTSPVRGGKGGSGSVRGRKETNMMKIDRVLAVSAGTKETKVDCHCQTVVVSNNSANVAYIAPYDANKALTAAAGFPIPANTVLQVPFAAGELAVVASAASTDVRFLLLD